MKSRLVSLVVALFASVCLWVYVVTVVNPEETTTIYNIPVTFVGEEEMREDQGLIITKGNDLTVNLKLNGKRSVCKKLSANNITINVDISRVKKAGSYNRSYDVVFPSELEDQDISILSRSPSSVSFTVEQLASKTVEVKGVLDGDVADGYMAEAMTFDYDEIEIEGPEKIINSVSYAQVILSQEKVDQTVTESLPYSLIDEEGNTVESDEISADVKEIEVTLPVVQYKEIPLSVELIEGGGATADNVVVSIDPQTVTVSGDAAALAEVSQIELDSVDLAKIEGDTTLTMPIKIPEGLKNVSGDEEAKVTVKIRGLDMKTVRASSMAFVNVPDGYVASSMTQMLQVKIRAASKEIGKITAEDLRVVADLSELKQAGTYTVPVTIEVSGYSGAGVIGEYTIVISLTPSE